MLPNFYIFSNELHFLLLKLMKKHFCNLTEKLNLQKVVFFSFSFLYIIWLIYCSSISFMMLSVVWLRIFHYCTRPTFQCSIKFLHKNITILQKSYLNLCHSKSYVFYFFHATQMELNKGWVNGDCAVQYGYCSACWCYILLFYCPNIQTYRHIQWDPQMLLGKLHWTWMKVSANKFS